MEYITGFHAIEEAVRAGNIRGRLYLSKTGGRHQKIEQEVFHLVFLLKSVHYKMQEKNILHQWVVQLIN